MCFFIFSAIFVRNVSRYKEKWARYDGKMYVGLHVKYWLFWSGLTFKILAVSLRTTMFNTLRTGSFKLFKLFKRPFPGFLTILTL